MSARSYTLIGLVLFLAGTLSLVMALGRHVATVEVVSAVEEIIEEGEGTSRKTTPVMTFEWEGMSRKFRAPAGLNIPEYRVGDRVPLLVDRTQPDQVNVGEKLMLWTIPLLFVFLSGICFWMASYAKMPQARK